MELPNLVTKLTIAMAFVFFIIILGTTLAVKKNKPFTLRDESNAKHIGEMQIKEGKCQTI